MMITRKERLPHENEAVGNLAQSSRCGIRPQRRDTSMVVYDRSQSLLGGFSWTAT